MSDEKAASASALDTLVLRVKMRSGEYCAARAGATLVFYYAKPMRQLVEVVRRLIDTYVAFIPDDSIRSALSSTGVWREFSKQGLSAAIRKLGAEEADYRSIHLSSGEPGNVGDFGLHFLGSNMLQPERRPRETCACIMEFPAVVLEGSSKKRFVDFAIATAEMEPFESGHGGYAFKHLSETWRDQALAWIAQRAPRYLALDISYDGLRRSARGRVANVSWLTFLGQDVANELGGTHAMRARLPDEVELRALANGLLLIAGLEAPIGDVNRGLADLRG